MCNLILNKYYQGDQIRRMGWAGHVMDIVQKRNPCMVLVRKLEGKRLLGRPRHRFEDNIKIYVKEMGCQGMD